MEPLELLLAAASLGSGLASSGAQSASTAADRKQQWEMFMRQLGDQRAGKAYNLSKDLDKAPLRDQAMYNLQQRLSAPSQPFNVGHFNDGKTPQTGGIDMNALNSKLMQYTPGAGGTAGSTRVGQQALGRYGYGPAAPPGNYAPDAVPNSSWWGPGTYWHAPQRGQDVYGSGWNQLPPGYGAPPNKAQNALPPIGAVPPVY